MSSKETHYLTSEEIDSLFTRAELTEEEIKNNQDLLAFRKMLDDSYKEKIKNIKTIKEKIIRFVLDIKMKYSYKSDDEIVDIIMNKEEVFSIEKYIEFWYGKVSESPLSKETLEHIEKSYLNSDAKTVIEFCNEEAMLEGTDGGD